MQIQLETQPYSSIQSDALVTYVFDKNDKFDGVLGDIDRAMDGRLARLVASGEITGKPLELLLLHFPEGLARRSCCWWEREAGEIRAVSDLRKIAGTALRHLKSRGVKKFVFLTREGRARTRCGAGRRRRADRRRFRIEQISHREKRSAKIQSVALAGFDSGRTANLTRRHRSRPHHCRIAEFRTRSDQRAFEQAHAAHARRESRGHGQGSGPAVEILDERKIAELKMGALIGVAQGSVEPPRMIVVRYTPENPKPGAPGARPGRQSRHVRYRRHFDQARRTTWKR